MDKIFQSLAHPVRRQILELLRDGPMSSGDIAARFEATWPTITRHLTMLRTAGLVEARRSGPSVVYRMAPVVLAEPLQYMNALACPPDRGPLSAAH